MYDAVSGVPTALLRGHASSVHAVAFSPAGRSIVTASYDSMAR